MSVGGIRLTQPTHQLITVCSAINRYVVNFPPATSHQPDSGERISWEREMSDGLPFGSANNGRNPAQLLMTSPALALHSGKNCL
jgi:hypothetical protein